MDDISRRDFLNGVALTVAAGSFLSPLELLAKSNTYYPPALTGLRGNHIGSFEVAHAVSIGNVQYSMPKKDRTWLRASRLVEYPSQIRMPVHTPTLMAPSMQPTGP